ncbi:MAG: hypothetical protein IJH84_07515, partial [Saccharopolyspora sp.]
AVPEKSAQPETDGAPEVPAPATETVTRRPRRRTASRAAGPPPDSPEAAEADVSAGATSEN